MSRLPNAPLLEVIFELRWELTINDINDFQYLHGDLYSRLKDKYPFRENLVPPGIPPEIVKGKPIYRFRSKPGGYPLLQVGPGLISINTIDEKYYWVEFSKEIETILDGLDSIYPKYKTLKLQPSLIYIDFLAYNKQDMTPQEFMNNNLHLNFKQDFIADGDAKLKEVNISLNYQVGTDIVSLNIADGQSNNDTGLILQTKIMGRDDNYSSGDLLKWLGIAHELSSTLFKSLTKGQLYESFKS